MDVETFLRTKVFDFPETIVNDPSKKGQQAAIPIRFGSWAGYPKYMVSPVYSRFARDEVSWFVYDLTNRDDMGMHPIIRQEGSLAEAVKGLIKIKYEVK